MRLGANIFLNALYGSVLGIVVTVALCVRVIAKGGHLSQNGLFWCGVWLAIFGSGCGIGSTRPRPEDRRVSWILISTGTAIGVLGTLGVTFLAPIPRQDAGGPLFLSVCVGLLAYLITSKLQFYEKGKTGDADKKT